MHDAVQIEALGTPATLVITEPFQGLAASFSQTLGMPGYHTVTVPHPIASKDEAQLQELAARVTDTVVDHLVTR